MILERVCVFVFSPVMAANKSVTVLAPNGRKQNVKVTPNSTILQILEEVCKKQGYDTDDYDLKHFHNVLDINAIFRFTGLSNNAQLEMVPCVKSRSSSNVTIGIQLENGERLTGVFQPSTSLAQILNETCPNLNFETAILIYMHREIYGKETLESTTLKSLGLNSGKAMLRLINRDPEQLKHQAHVHVPLAPKIAKETPSNNDTYRKTPSSIKNDNKILDPLTLAKQERSQEQLRNTEHMQDNIIRKDTKACEQSEEDVKIHNDTEGSICPPVSKDKDLKENAHNNEYDNMDENIKIDFLGERNALVFNQAGVKALPKDELPDDFFDLTVDDAKKILRDVKRRRKQLEDAPLLTNAQRQFDRDKWMLEQLHRYKRAIIRIQFPDQFVLQGLFEPLEMVQAIKDFIKLYLEDPNCEFVIYTTPPKKILNSTLRLIDEDLVPSAIVYYSGASSLRQDVKERLTDPIAASVLAAKSRTAMVRQDENTTIDEDQNSVDESENDNLAVASTSKNSSSNSETTPKWFKPFK